MNSKRFVPFYFSFQFKFLYIQGDKGILILMASKNIWFNYLFGIQLLNQIIQYHKYEIASLWFRRFNNFSLYFVRLFIRMLHCEPNVKCCIYIHICISTMDEVTYIFDNIFIRNRLLGGEKRIRLMFNDQKKWHSEKLY